MKIKHLMFMSLLMASTTLMAAMPDRIAVLPFYVESGELERNSGLTKRDYRRVGAIINNKLVKYGFDVVNVSAADLKQQDYDTLAKRFKEDSQSVVTDVTRKYSVDAVYIIWLEVENIWEGNFCKVLLAVDGEGYTSDGSSLGLAISWEVQGKGATKCARSLKNAQKIVADKIGTSIALAKGASNSSSSSPLKKRLDNQRPLITIRLDGIIEYEAVEAMGKALNTARGVISAKRLGGNLDGNNPSASYEEWRIQIDNARTEPFRIQANIMKMIKDVIYHNGSLTLKGVPYRYTAREVDLLKGVRPGRSTSKEIQFTFDIDKKLDTDFD